MARAMSTLLLLAGATLLVTWLVTPAVSAPPPQTPAPRTALDDEMPLIADVDAQVLALHDRMATTAADPAPLRDPFSYATRAPRPRVTVPQPAAIAPPMPDAPQPPTLVAILSAGGASPRRAVLTMSDDADVSFLTIGETIGRFIVRDVQDDVVILADTKTNDTTRLTLR